MFLELAACCPEADPDRSRKSSPKQLQRLHLGSEETRAREHLMARLIMPLGPVVLGRVAKNPQNVEAQAQDTSHNVKWNIQGRENEAKVEAGNKDGHFCNYN